MVSLSACTQMPIVGCVIRVFVQTSARHWKTSPSSGSSPFFAPGCFAPYAYTNYIPWPFSLAIVCSLGARILFCDYCDHVCCKRILGRAECDNQTVCQTCSKPFCVSVQGTADIQSAFLHSVWLGNLEGIFATPSRGRGGWGGFGWIWAARSLAVGDKFGGFNAAQTVFNAGGIQDPGLGHRKITRPSKKCIWALWTVRLGKMLKRFAGNNDGIFMKGHHKTRSWSVLTRSGDYRIIGDQIAKTCCKIQSKKGLHWSKHMFHGNGAAVKAGYITVN